MSTWSVETVSHYEGIIIKITLESDFLSLENFLNWFERLAEINSLFDNRGQLDCMCDWIVFVWTHWDDVWGELGLFEKVKLNWTGLHHYIYL